MRIPKSSDLVSQIPSEVGITLPDFAHLDELGGLPGGRNWILSQITQNELSFVNAQIWQQASQIALKNIISGVGVPSGAIADTVVSVLGAFDPELSAEQMLARIAKSLEQALINLTTSMLTKAIEAGLGYAIDMVANVPIVGWVIQICWNIGKLIYKLTKFKDPYEAKKLYPPSRFSPTVDRNLLNSVLLQLESNDWSSLFYPPSVGKNASWKQEIYLTPLEAGGTRFIGSNPGGEPIPGSAGLIADPWLGFVPGTGWLHQSIEILNPQHNLEITETGATLLPSAQRQCGWLWRQISRTNSPAAFTVHCDVVESFWQSYIEDLRLAIKTSPLSKALRRDVFRFYDRQKDPKTGKSNPIFGWGDGQKEIEYAPPPLLRLLRQRQLDFCDTLTVAYLDPSFGAMQDPVVRAKMNRRQRDLLEHPALCDVDLGNVRDELYRAEIVERRKGMQCFVAPTDKVLGGGSGPGPGNPHSPTNDFLVGGSGPQPPDLPDGFATPDTFPGNGRNKWAYVAGGAGVVLAGAAGYHYRREIEAALKEIRIRFPGI